ncbi:hypothetical protein [Actinomycetospora termitidis]|uniref:Excalibur calcium-binding domain-containing protein n=1 Tax=Actinomycetospora termitidis TaxID=3053470 RepID=A0ABT7M630_9PSEU|nr:hypothetical protein [Actinomycetospora sp. Odt1-22]MDL5156106.1 hypothetical protein [Actinomycetospora sp. Odt1-22]
MSIPSNHVSMTERSARCNDEALPVEVVISRCLTLGEILSVLVHRRLVAGLGAAVMAAGLLLSAGSASAQDSSDPKCVAVATAKKAKTTAEAAYDDAKTKLTNASSAVTEAESAANAAPNDADLQTKLTAARAAHNQAMTAEAAADSTRKGAAMNLSQAVDAAVKAGLDCDGTNPPKTPVEVTDPPKTPPSPAKPDNGGGNRPGGPGKPAGPDLNCRDFVSRPAAQAVLDADRSDPYRLDADHDGYACEDFFGEPSEDPDVDHDVTVDHTDDDDSDADTSGDQVTVVPEGSADTGSAL